MNGYMTQNLRRETSKRIVWYGGKSMGFGIMKEAWGSGHCPLTLILNKEI